MNTTSQKVMRCAWAIFAERYGYRGPVKGTPFKSISMPCFVWCLRQAWTEAKDAAVVAAIPAEEKAARIEAFRARIADLQWMENFRQAEANRAVYKAEIRRLGA